MDFSSSAVPPFRPSEVPQQNIGPTPPSSTSLDDLTRIFNTALLSTRVGAERGFSAEIRTLVESPAFRSILMSIRQHARLQGISERDAAEQLIQTFRKLDATWSDYVFREGVEKIRG